jgi:hypothetical protein
VKPKVHWWRWAQWWAIMAPALVVFYVILMPVWLGIRILRLIAQARSR